MDEKLAFAEHGISRNTRRSACEGSDIARSRQINSGLCISGYTLDNWMASVKDDTLVSALTIPGTHDSVAFTHQWPFVATQKMPILQQLNGGIRYFDLRCGLRNDVVEMVHGPSLLGLTFADVLETMYDWLETHPTEGIVAQIKEDREPQQSSLLFSQAIGSHISARADRWRTSNTTPRLGQLRGNIQLFRRFSGANACADGIDVTVWPDNQSTPFTIVTQQGVQITIQDHYGFTDPTPLPGLIAAKSGDILGLLNRACGDEDQSHWYLNFASAYELNIWYQITPYQLAVGGYYGFSWQDGINVRLRDYLRTRPGKPRFGIVAMDFPELGTEDLLVALVETNLEKNQKSTWGVWLLAVLFMVMALYFLPSISNEVLTELVHFPGKDEHEHWRTSG